MWYIFHMHKTKVKKIAYPSCYSVVYISYAQNKGKKFLALLALPHCRISYICTLLRCGTPTVCNLCSYFVDTSLVDKKQEENTFISRMKK